MGLGLDARGALPTLMVLGPSSSSSTGQAYSRLLDSRWAEVSLIHSREQMDLTERRQKLQKGQAGNTTQSAGDGAPAAPGRRLAPICSDSFTPHAPPEQATRDCLVEGILNIEDLQALRCGSGFPPPATDCMWIYSWGRATQNCTCRKDESCDHLRISHPLCMPVTSV